MKNKKHRKPRWMNRAHDFTQTWEWIQIRDRALKKYGRNCVRCGSNKSINVDHVQPRRTHPELALTIENLQILCAPCNKQKGVQYSDYRQEEIRPTTERSKLVDFILRKNTIERGQ